jgi:hypothetical protein
MSDTFWSILYMVGYVALLAWTRRADWRARATALPAACDVLGGVCLSVPALAWLDGGVAAHCSDAVLRVTFVLGVASLAWFTRHDLRRAHANAALAPRLRRRFALVTLAGALVGAGPDVWWGLLALAHAPRA